MMKKTRQPVREFVFRTPEEQPAVSRLEWSADTKPEPAHRRRRWWLLVRDLLSRLPADVGSDPPNRRDARDGWWRLWRASTRS
jgi:hypothetical protein